MLVTIAVLALGAGSACAADQDGATPLPHHPQPSSADDQPYSYYYVPRLGGLNRVIGALLRNSRLQLALGEPAMAVARYAAFSCAGTFYLKDATARPAEVDIDWSTVRDLRAAADGAAGGLLIERGAGAGDDARLRLIVEDPAQRYRLQQMLAILYSECRGRTRVASPPAAAVSAP
ncbi:MAG: hypothetical protein JSR73_05280 [Proteobacteria bacterium]|nr:hypothetical protein [Pseudomonadota bacterium]